jgi:hypothetical protein
VVKKSRQIKILSKVLFKSINDNYLTINIILLGTLDNISLLITVFIASFDKYEVAVVN